MVTFLRNNLIRQWYVPSLTGLTRCLLPFSWTFRAFVRLRRFLYQIHLRKITVFPVPIIVVGNITVGGTGKTPFVIELVNVLKQQGYNPGIVSRGAGGAKHRTPYWVTNHSDVRYVGDEAVLLAKRTGVPLVVCTQRVSAVKALLANAGCDVVISDDGLQHYALKRDIEIVMVDMLRGLGNQQLLPAGPLREPMSRLAEADFIIRTSLSSSLTFRDLSVGFSKPQYNMTLQGDTLISVQHETKKLSIQDLPPGKVHAVAAIGNPQRFFSMLRQQGCDVIEHSFPDHYVFTPMDLNFSDKHPIIMTEKDAVKCQLLANERCWYVPLKVLVDNAFWEVLRQAL